MRVSLPEEDELSHSYHLKTPCGILSQCKVILKPLYETKSLAYDFIPASAIRRVALGPENRQFTTMKQEPKWPRPRSLFSPLHDQSVLKPIFPDNHPAARHLHSLSFQRRVVFIMKCL